MSVVPYAAEVADLPMSERIVSDLVAEDPRRAAVFELVDIDYCCGGNVPLAEACRDHDLDTANVVAMLVDASSGDEDVRNWQEASIPELVTNIVEVHHAYLHQELPRIAMLAHKVAKAHGQQTRSLLEAELVVVELVDELQTHTAREDQEIFPMCIAVFEGRTENKKHISELLGDLMRDHDETAEHLRRLRELTNGYEAPVQACTSWRAYLDALQRLELDTHRHVHKENHILFPKVQKLLAATPAND